MTAPRALPPNWHAVIGGELEKPYMRRLLERLQGCVALPPKNVLRAFKLTDFDQVRVVILGQDPYYTPGLANGLAFGVDPEIFPKPPTLLSVLREVERNIGRQLDYEQSSLEGWAAQGVLLLNTILTTAPNEPLAHAGWGWERFVEEALLALAARPGPPLVVMLWGNRAAQYEWLFDGHCVLKATHPSPNSANMGPIQHRFVGCRHFERANLFLESKGLPMIDWGKT